MIGEDTSVSESRSEKKESDYKDIFVNPITGAEEEISVKVGVPQQAYTDLQTQWGIDVETMVETAARKEIEYSKTHRYVDSITEYAKDNGQHKVIVFEVNEGTADMILDLTKEIVSKSEEPAIITNAQLCTVLTEKMTPETCQSKDAFKDKAIYTVGVINREIDEKEKLITVCCYACLTWADNNLLVYDRKNPKTSLYIEFQKLT